MSERISDIRLIDANLDEALQGLFDECLDHEELCDLRVFESIRSPVRQEELYARGRDPKAVDFGRTVTRSRAYQSAHQFGMAVDLVFYVNMKWTWDEPKKGAWDLLHKLAVKEGLEPLSFEKPHLQLKGFNWRKLKAGPKDEKGWLKWMRKRNGG